MQYDDRSVLEHDQIRTPAPTTGQFKLKNQAKVAGAWETTLQFVSHDIQRPIPSEELRRAGLSCVARQLAEHFVLRSAKERFDRSQPRVRMFGHTVSEVGGSTMRPFAHRSGRRPIGLHERLEERGDEPALRLLRNDDEDDTHGRRVDETPDPRSEFTVLREEKVVPSGDFPIQTSVLQAFEAERTD